jgi:hypothetical protein
MSALPPHLARLGDALERAAANDLRQTKPLGAANGRRRVPRRLLLVAAALAVGGSTAAGIATQLVSEESVAQSMPAGALMLVGTDPTCTLVTEGVEYHCVLRRAPDGGIDDYMGTVYETVDASQHVNGGCRSLRSDGLEWQCYIGQAAVDQQIISQDFLGEIQTVPAVG